MGRVEDVLDRLRVVCGKADAQVALMPVVTGRFAVAQLQFSVAGVGALSVPASAVELEALSARTRAAPFGLGTQTLVDTAVRDTGEMDADAITLDWAPGAQERLCGEIAQALGLPAVALQLHKLLSYGPGQFFKTHQDTARQPEMIGTLILIWPSAHLGGALHIRHQDADYVFESQQLGHDGAIRWCAFYADCHHEVRPVTEGQRLALSFEVLVSEPADAEKLPAPKTDADLCQALQALFETPNADAPACLQPWCLMLDHQYSARGLHWRHLKGRDRAIATTLRAAAAALGYSVDLALLEQNDIWDSSGFDESDFVDYQDWEDSDGDQPVDPLEVKPPPLRRRRRGQALSLIDRCYLLTAWLGADGQVHQIESLRVDEDDVAALRRNGPAHVINQEYEGYMGNYGETMSYWYRRAVLVVQSPAVARRLCYQTQLRSMLRALAQRASSPQGRDSVLAEIAIVRDLLVTALGQTPQEMLPQVLEVAAALPADAAEELLKPLHHGALGPADVPALLRLQQAHGADWLQTMLTHWTSRPDLWAPRIDGAPPIGQLPWPAQLDVLCADWVALGLDAKVLEAWQAAILKQFLRREDAWRSLHPADRNAELDQRLPWIQRLLRGLNVGAHHAAEARLQAALCALVDSAAYPLPALVDCVQAAADARPGIPSAVIDQMRAQLRNALDAALATPPLAPGDQSLRDISWICRCARCQPVIRWAESSDGAPYAIAIAEDGRKHIRHSLKSADAPIRTETIKRGSPHSLMCHKATNATERDAKQRLAWERARERLGV